MSFVDYLLSRFREFGRAPAIAFRDRTINFEELAAAVERARRALPTEISRAGTVVTLEADYSPESVALLLALIERNIIIAPMTPNLVARSPELIDIVAAQYRLTPEADGTLQSRPASSGEPRHPLYEVLRQRGVPGLVLFTSGSSGAPKGVVHDFSLLLEKFRSPRPGMRTINFLLFDHWGGLNTLFNGLSSGSLLVLPESRTPAHVCDLIARHRIELLPSTPSFLNLLLLSKAWHAHDLSSLRLITYGAEPMPESTLAAARKVFPNVEFRQTYGLIELGVLRAKSRGSDSLWVKIGGQGYDLRVVDGLLQIKAKSAMLGYLNAPSPFTEDGYFMTGDRVEVDGEYMHILGRQSELINVGGDKVYPAEVEAVLLACEQVLDAAVYGEKHPLMGSIVCADVRLTEGLDENSARLAIKQACNRQLPRFKVPVKINIVGHDLINDRLKRNRRR